MKTTWIVAVVAAFAAAVPLSAGPRGPAPQTQAANAPAPATPKGDAASGKKLFVNYGCYQCHGYEGQGSTATGPRLAPRPIAFAAFSKQLRRPSSEMPPYTAKVATDAQLADIYAYLQSVPPPKDPDTIPLLK